MIEQYKRNGFVVVQAPELVDYFPDASRADFHEGFRQMHAHSIDRYLAHVRMLSRMALVHTMFACSSIWKAALALGVTTPLFQTAPAVHVMGEDLKIPGGYDGVGAHQDWPALQSGLNTIVVWIPYWDCDEDNYPVEVVPGSHLHGLFPAVAGQHISEINTHGMEFVPVPVKRGEALLFSAFTVHRTRTPGRGFRIAFSHRYEDAADQWFQDHDYFFSQSRQITRAIWKEPTESQVRRVFA